MNLLWFRMVCYFLIIKYNTNLLVFLILYQSHCSDIFLAVLSLLVWLLFEYCFRHHNNRRSLSPLNLWRHPAVVLGFRTCSHRRYGVSHCRDHCCLHHRYKHCSDYGFEGTTKIVLHRSTKSWKPQCCWRLHVPPRAAQSFCMVDHAPHAPPRTVSSDHTLSRAPTLLLTSSTSALTCAVANITCLRQPLTSSFDSGYLTVDF